MSSSQLLTITESLGFRALIAVDTWLITAMRSLWHGLRNLTCCDKQRAGMDAAPLIWASNQAGGQLCSLMETVFWFDTREGPGGPPILGGWPRRSSAYSHATFYCLGS